MLFLTADARRQTQTFLSADSRDFTPFARDKLAGKKHVNRCAIKNSKHIIGGWCLNSIMTPNYIIKKMRLSGKLQLDTFEMGHTTKNTKITKGKYIILLSSFRVLRGYVCLT